MNSNFINTSKDFRYERKFKIPKHFEDYSYTFIKSNFDYLSDHYLSRRVNSIYFDTNDFKFAKQNINGDNKRNKIRLRYYGNIAQIKNPNIEIKSKSGNVGEKILINAYKDEEYIKRNFDFNYLKDNYLITELSLKMNFCLSELKPRLFVSYFRNYFISKCKTFRLTFDQNLLYRNIDFPLSKESLSSENFILGKESILEIKYSSKFDLNNFLKKLEFPFRLSKNSKYINGLNETGILKNIF